VLGASGIGAVHVRNFLSIGVKIVSILSSSKKTGIETSRRINKLYGIDIDYFTDLNELINNSMPDAISICTPADLHYEQLCMLIKKGIPVFCEKPLFWNKDISLDELNRKLDYLSRYENKTLFVNTSNIYFIDSIQNKLPRKELIKNFIFRFYTNGIFRKTDIAYDLLPHGLSVLVKILGKKSLTEIQRNVSNNNYKCSFKYGSCFVEFDFSQSDSISKELSFDINERKYIRVQKGDYEKYEVFLKDINADKLIKTEDPFLCHMKKFINICKSEKLSKNHDSFDESSLNLQLMGQILLK
jgi:hypothetical protein